MSKNACGSCAKTAMTLGWRNQRGGKQIREKPEQGGGKKSCARSTRGSGRNGVVDCCPRHEVDICSLELDENFSWVTKKHIEKLEKNYTDMDGNPGKNLIDFFHSGSVPRL